MLRDLLTQDGILLSRSLKPFIDDSRSIARDVESGVLVRIRRGAYAAGEVWEGSSPVEKHLLRMRAVVALADRPPTFSSFSSAAVWGMPICGEWPRDVFVADDWHGGGRSEPGIRLSAAGFPSARVVEIDGFRVVDLARTALVVARATTFLDAIGSIDWVQWRKNKRQVSREALAEDLEQWHPRTGFRHLERVLAFSTHLSDSFGESRARAAIHLAGFERPELQVEFVDSQGSMFVDFYWPRARAAAEFDGRVKYTRDEFTKGDPSNVVWAEKKRQDRLYRQGLAVDRITTYDIEHPKRLAEILTGLGVSRRL
jgi:hypothetical protein